jgi:hypothetical protein
MPASYYEGGWRVVYGESERNQPTRFWPPLKDRLRCCISLLSCRFVSSTSCFDRLGGRLGGPVGLSLLPDVPRDRGARLDYEDSLALAVELHLPLQPGVEHSLACNFSRPNLLATGRHGHGRAQPR